MSPDTQCRWLKMLLAMISISLIVILSLYFMIHYTAQTFQAPTKSYDNFSQSPHEPFGMHTMARIIWHTVLLLIPLIALTNACYHGYFLIIGAHPREEDAK